MNAAERVRAWRDAARRAYRPTSSSTIAAIARESGLSRASVEDAITRLLEVDDDVAPLVARASGDAISAIAVVLSANVFIAPYRAIAWALARSPRVFVRTSSRATAFLDAVDTDLYTHLEPRDFAAIAAALPTDAAIDLYGGRDVIDEASRALSSSTIALHAHGPGLGAVVGRASSIIGYADAIAHDIAAFDQRGCLSPRIVLSIGGSSDAADALHASLAALDVTQPRGLLSSDETLDQRLAVDAASFSGRARVGEGHAVLDLGDTPSLPIGPVGRVIPIVSVTSYDEAFARLSPIAAQLTNVAIDDGAVTLPFSIRRAALGAMQRPPFDGPVDYRVK